jgi:hypothetical protein
MKLSAESFGRAARFLRTEARPLERALFAHAFEAAPVAPALSELARFANPDGGFGHGLEPDLRVPDSSALATSHALTILRSLGRARDEPAVAAALGWLADHFDATCSAWRAVPPNVDAHPHAAHWAASLHEPGGGWPVAVIPCAEALSHFFHYGGGRSAQIDAACAGLLAALPETALGPDGVLYLDRLARTRGLPVALSDALAEHLPRLALAMLERDPEKWGGYVANPLKLAPTPDSTVAVAFRADLEANLDWAIQQQRADGSWAPNWTWQGAYPEAWERAHREWQGILTLERLESFRAWGRLGF